MIVRPGIRPEVFSMLLVAVFFTILWGVHRRTLPARGYGCCRLEILWVNLHAGFALGPVLIGTFFGMELVSSGKPAAGRLEALDSSCRSGGDRSCRARQSERNPRLVVSPYCVFQLRNGRAGEPVHVPAPGHADRAAHGNRGPVPGGYLVMAYRRRVKIEWPLLLLSGAFGLMSLIFYRIYVFAGGFILVAICANIALSLLHPKTAKSKTKTKPSIAWLGWIWTAAGFAISHLPSPRWNNVGLGLEAGDAEIWPSFWRPTISQERSLTVTQRRLPDPLPAGPEGLHRQPAGGIPRVVCTRRLHARA